MYKITDLNICHMQSYDSWDKHTSISCTCSSLLMYICCRESSSSLLRSRRVLPSSAAKCKSDRSQGRRKDVNRRKWWERRAQEFTSSCHQEGFRQVLLREALTGAEQNPPTSGYLDLKIKTPSDFYQDNVRCET